MIPKMWKVSFLECRADSSVDVQLSSSQTIIYSTWSCFEVFYLRLRTDISYPRELFSAHSSTSTLNIFL